MSLPPPPAELASDQANDVRPLYPEAAATSEAAHEAWADDVFDWADRRNLLAYRWCELWNRYAAVKTDCGPKPVGVQ